MLVRDRGWRGTRSEYDAVVRAIEAALADHAAAADLLDHVGVAGSAANARVYLVWTDPADRTEPDAVALAAAVDARLAPPRS